jgi:hypothetical protein
MYAAIADHFASPALSPVTSHSTPYSFTSESALCIRMSHVPRTPRAVSASPRRRRSHAGRIAAAALGVASATGLGLGLNHADKPISGVAAPARILPDSSLTPGTIDPKVNGHEICTETWRAGPNGAPPVQGGNLTYSKAARHTSQTVKEQAFSEYGIQDPHDGGQSYEVDHLIPLSLGGRDVLSNLWPQSRTALGFNSWVKDRLEFRLYNLVCRPKPGDPPVSLSDAQEALQGDWTKAYETYCSNEDDCPAYGDSGD